MDIDIKIQIDDKLLELAFDKEAFIANEIKAHIPAVIEDLHRDHKV